MISIKFLPKRGDNPTVRGQRLYEAFATMTGGGRRQFGFKIRAKNAADAERKLEICLQDGLEDRILDFDVDEYLKKKATSTEGGAAGSTPA